MIKENKNMKRSKLLIGVLAVLFILLTAASIFTLSLEALDNGHSEDGGTWAEVCCGTKCQGGKDYCSGEGRFNCCK